MRIAIAFLFVLTVPALLRAQVVLENAFPALSFNRPVDLQHAGDGSNRLYVVEQSGRILTFDNSSAVTVSAVFLDIRSRVNSSGNEEGLLGLAFDPAFTQNGYFYVNYTASNPRRTVISRFSMAPGAPHVADALSERVLLEFPQPYSNHNGGQIAFGPDGFLYIATGDGGSGGDPQNNAQNLGNLLGKILRIDVSREVADKRYAIPADNPFAGNTAGHREEIWAYGLRNPWRFSFDRVSGRLWTGDVGQNRFEEVDIIERGKNYGWRVMEGFVCYNPASGCDESGLEKPVVTYGRSDGASITGGYVYRGTRVPELQGKYIYADFVSGNIWALDYAGPGNAENTMLLRSSQNIASFGVDAANELYACSFSGEVLRFTSTVSSASPAPQRTGLSIDSFHPHPVSAEDAKLHVRVSVPESGYARLRVVDMLGRERTAVEQLAPGRLKSRAIDISTLPQGSYILTLESGSQRVSRTFLVTR